MIDLPFPCFFRPREPLGSTRVVAKRGTRASLVIDAEKRVR